MTKYLVTVNHYKMVLIHFLDGQSAVTPLISSIDVMCVCPHDIRGFARFLWTEMRGKKCDGKSWETKLGRKSAINQFD